MIAQLVASLAGMALGGGLVYVSLRVGLCPEPGDHELADTDREVVATEFSQHVTAVDRQVSDYADQLAGSDVALRGLLATIERGRAGDATVRSGSGGGR